MAKNIELEQLVINKLTQEQFDSIEEKNPAELYFITDAEVDGGKGAQVEEMPEATEMNAGQIVQYVGETIPNIEATATITQTVGDSLTDLKVNAKKFEKASGLTEPGSLEFVFEIIKDNAILGEQVGTFSYSFDSDKFISNLISTWGENWWEMVGGTDMFFVYANNNMWGLSNSVPLLEETMGSQVRAWLAETDDWGFYVSDDSQVVNNDYLPVSVVFGSTKWLQDTNEILPSDYGISYSGTPSNGDTLKVDYTPFVGGYEKGYFYVNQAHDWNQINVQPASSNGSEIEWVTKVDLPGDYYGDLYTAAPYYTIEGGLPNGTYEFYLSTKNLTDSNLPLGEVIFKVLLVIDNENMQAYGRMGYVFDGNYMNDANNIFSPYPRNMWNVVHKNNSDIVLYSSETPWATSVLAYNDHQGVLECFKLTEIRNIETGEVYIATGNINIDGSAPEHQNDYGGYVQLREISSQQSTPQYKMTYTGDFNSDIQYFTLHQSNAIACGRSACCSELDVSCSSSNGGKYHVIIENKTNSYVIYLKEASGDLENAQIGWNQYYSPYLFLNTKDEESGKITISVGAKGNDNGSSVHCYADTPYSFTPAVITRVGGEINEANHGMILQYQKDSTEEYTQGYFYKATGEKAIVPASIDISWQNPENVTIEIDVDKLVTELNVCFGWEIAWLQEIMKETRNWVYYNYDTPYVYFDFYGDIYIESIVSCFTIYNSDTLENGYVEFQTTNYQLGHIEIINGKWEQINVQPGSEGGLTKEEADETYSTKEELNSKIPPHPTDDGVYTLACSVVNGVATYSWESIA